MPMPDPNGRLMYNQANGKQAAWTKKDEEEFQKNRGLQNINGAIVSPPQPKRRTTPIIGTRG